MPPIILPPISSASAYGFDTNEMIEQVQDEIRNVSIPTKILRWLNMSIIEIASQYIFGTLNQNAVALTVPSTPDVTLAEDILWLKTIQMPDVNRTLFPEDEHYIADGDPDYRVTTGTVTHYYLNNPILGLYKVPIGTENITYSYQRRPLKLSLITDVCELPIEWHNLVMQKAITKGYSYEGNPEGKASSVQEELILLKRLGANAYRRPDDRAVVGTSAGLSRPARPVFPYNYPKVRI